MRKLRAVRTVTPTIVARWLEVKPDTVLKWIQTGALPAMNISTGDTVRRYIIFRKDLIAFCQARGLTIERTLDVVQL